jgi:hypothetical protein
MIGLIRFVLHLLNSLSESRFRLKADNAAIQSVFGLAGEATRPRPAHEYDRWFFIERYRGFPSILKALTVGRSNTLVH